MSELTPQRERPTTPESEVAQLLSEVERRLGTLEHRLAALPPAAADAEIEQLERALRLPSATVPRPRRRTRIARLVRCGWIAGIVTGVLLIADGVATIVWQEPFTAIYTSLQQHRLAGQLDGLARDYARQRAATFANAAARFGRLAQPGDPIGRIEIPSLQTRFIVVQGTGTSSLELGPGHYSGTSLPGEPGTVGIAGHRTTYLAPFRHLDELHRGLHIVLAMPYGRFTYRVTGTGLVNPSQSGILRSATTGQRLVLTTCDPVFSDARRLVVFAQLTRERRI